MKMVTLGKTRITVPQNAFGALPVQRASMEDAIAILRKAREGGVRFFDTARAYSDSEEKIGRAFGDGKGPDWGGDRSSVYIATKTTAQTPEDFRRDLETSLQMLQTDYIDIYQFHMMGQCWRPGDGTGMYECMQKAKEQGKIHHISGTAHKIGVAFEIAESGLYETLQFPFSYLAAEKDLKLVSLCAERGVGFIAMKGLAGGLINRADAAMAFMTQFDNVLPIWGIQRMDELLQWLAFMEETPEMTPEIEAFIRGEQEQLSGNFCRGCGYCMPCPKGILINQCARMSLMLRRAPSEAWLSDFWQEQMEKIETCINCRSCTKHCPYELDTPRLLQENLADYRRVLAGEVRVN